MQNDDIDRLILHVDINSYFATILQQEVPALRGQPIGVIKDVGRTCIIAASKEAKRRGVQTGSRAREARQLCPEIQLVPASFERYLDATKRLQRVFSSIAPDIYIYSLDEAFVDITACRRHLYPDPHRLGQDIQGRIQTELGSFVTANVGIGPNRLLAKLASEIAPKGSVFEINQTNCDGILAEVSFDDVCGIGYRLAKKLARLGVTHPYQIRFFDDEALLPIFGPYWTPELKKIAYGEEPDLLARLDTPKKPHMQSVGRSITGYRLYDPSAPGDQAAIKSILYNLSLEVVDKLRAMNLAGRHVHLSLTGHDRYWSAHRTLKVPFNHSPRLLEEIERLYQTWPADFSIIKFAVRLSLLQPQQQPELLPKWTKTEALQTALDRIHERFGLFTVHPATVSRENLIRPEVTGFLGDRLYQLR